MTKPPLHPDRIRHALRFWQSPNPIEIKPDEILQIHESAIAALELVRKCQLAMGLTPHVVDATAFVAKLLEMSRL